MVGFIPLFKSHNSFFEYSSRHNSLKNYEEDLSKILIHGNSYGIAHKAFRFAFNNLVAVPFENIPAILFQTDRDYFGTHSYQQSDAAPTRFSHTNWTNK